MAVRTGTMKSLGRTMPHLANPGFCVSCSTARLVNPVNRRRPVPYFPDTGLIQIQFLFFQISLNIHGSASCLDFSGHHLTCQMAKLAAEVDPIVHFCHFHSNPATSTCMWQQINSKIVAICLCHSTITLILELTSILVWFIYQIIHLQSLLKTLNAIFGSWNISDSASDHWHVGSESGMTI